MAQLPKGGLVRGHDKPLHDTTWELRPISRDSMSRTSSQSNLGKYFSPAQAPQ